MNSVHQTSKFSVVTYEELLNLFSDSEITEIATEMGLTMKQENCRH